MLYLPIEADHIAFLAEVSKAAGAPVVGMTTGGAAFTERGMTRGGAVGALLAGDDLDVSIAVANGVHENPQALRQAIKSLTFKPGRQSALMTLADAFACDGEALVAALRESTPMHVKHFGGTAGDNWTLKGTKVFSDGKAISNTVVFVALSSQAPLSLSVRHGWTAAEGSKELTVTSIKDNVLLALDGKPALEVYQDELHRLGLLAAGQEVVKSIAKYELGVRTPFGEQLKIRAPLAVGADGSITLASSILEGSVVRVATTTPDRLVEAAKALAARVLEPLKTKGVNGSLVFDCSARMQLFGNRYDEEARAFRGGGEQPMLGMCCYGEIAKFPGSVEGFHNTTAVMASW